MLVYFLWLCPLDVFIIVHHRRVPPSEHYKEQCSGCALLLPACLADPLSSLPVLAAVLTCLTCLGTWTSWCSVEGYFHIIFGNPPCEQQRITKPHCLCGLLVAGENLSRHRLAEDIIVLPPISVCIRRQLWCAVPAKQLWCLFSCSYYKSASGKGRGRALPNLPRSPRGTCTGLLSVRSDGLVCRMALEQILPSWSHLSCCM